MATRRTKTYTLEGKRYLFDNRVFDNMFRHRAKRAQMRLIAYAEVFATEIGVSRKTVDAWRYSQNAPMDYEIVVSIAKALGISSKALLTEVEAGNMTKLTPNQLEAVARVYSEVTDFLRMLDMTDGCVWKAYSIQPGSPSCKYLVPDADSLSSESTIMTGEDLALAGYNYTLHSLYREWPYLGSHPVFDELLAFMDGPMDAVWNGKTDPDYRFHYCGKVDDPAKEPYPGYIEEYADWIGTAEVDKAIRDIISKYSE